MHQPGKNNPSTHRQDSWSQNMCDTAGARAPARNIMETYCWAEGAAAHLPNGFNDTSISIHVGEPIPSMWYVYNMSCTWETTPSVCTWRTHVPYPLQRDMRTGKSEDFDCLSDSIKQWSIQYIPMTCWGFSLSQLRPRRHGLSDSHRSSEDIVSPIHEGVNLKSNRSSLCLRLYSMPFNSNGSSSREGSAVQRTQLASEDLIVSPILLHNVQTQSNRIQIERKQMTTWDTYTTMWTSEDSRRLSDCIQCHSIPMEAVQGKGLQCNARI